MLDDRFWSKVKKTDGCWLWTSKRNRQGYGVFSVHHKHKSAHVVSWQEAHGAIPAGLVLDHLCHTADCRLGNDCPHRRCVRPDHLGLATRRENTLRGATVTAVNAVKTVCDHGHPFDEANTYWTPTGKRNCRTCKRETQARYAERKKASR